MFKRLLICTDLVDGLQRLVDFVPSLAVGGVEQIVFLHIAAISQDQAVPRVNEEEVAAARKRLTVAQSKVPEGVDVRVDVQSGQAVDRIQNAIATYKSDIVFVGSQSRSLLTEKLFGSTTTSLCQRIKIPVLILRPQLLSTYTVEELDLRCRHIFRYFLIPYDGSNVADYLVKQIKQIAQDRASESLDACLISWVVETGGRRALSALVREEETKKAKTKLQQVKAELESLGLQITTQVLQGEPVPEILMSAQEYDITAIAIASDSFGKLLELSIPSFAGEMLRRSWHPVIYFPLVKG
ncbi:MAG: universal stress protein [Elainellaceae cyanobacterium]